MGEVIRFPLERRDHTVEAGAARARSLQRRLFYHMHSVDQIRRELGINETTQQELARLAMRVCDLVLASRDSSGDEHQQLVDEGAKAIRDYEELKQKINKEDK